MEKGHVVILDPLNPSVIVWNFQEQSYVMQDLDLAISYYHSHSFPLDPVFF